MAGDRPDNIRTKLIRLTRSAREVTLRQKSNIPVWIQLGWRALLVVSILVFVILVHWLERDGLRDNLDDHVSFLDVIYFTMISITTTGYGDVVPVTDATRLFDAIVVTPIRIFFVLIFLGTAYTFILRRTWERWRMEKIQRKLRNHIVVAGYGTSGSEAVAELLARGAEPGRIVVIDCNDAALQHAETLGCIVLNDDATRDKTLMAVRIASAKALIVSAGKDDASILITLTARHLAPAIPISVTVRNADNELLARQAGATTVINPVSFAGLLLAGSTHGEHIADYLADLASSSGRVQLHEREVHSSEYGKSLADVVKGLGVRLYRDGKPYGFWEPEAATLQPGDRIIEIMPTMKREASLA